MKRIFAFVALSLALSGCGGGGSRSLPAVSADAPGFTPAMPSALAKAPQSREFARPSLPSALQQLKTPQLTIADGNALLVHRSSLSAARTPQGRAAGFFANETYIGKDATGFAAYWMPYFGFYTYASATPGAIPYPGFLYKYGFSWLYDLGSTNAGSSDAYFFDFGTPDGYVGVFYTAPDYGSDANSLYLYSFLVGHFMAYQQNSNAPRWFYDYGAAKWLTGNPPMSEPAGGAAAWVRPDSHKTLYYLDVETDASQMCTGSCLSAWPTFPVLPGSAAGADTAMITRPDGGEQWTYKGHPLYTFAGDGSADQTNGDNIPDFGGHWHVARPASAATPPPDPPPHCTGYDC